MRGDTQRKRNRDSARARPDDGGGAFGVSRQLAAVDDRLDEEQDGAGGQRAERVARSQGDAEDSGVNPAGQNDDGAPCEQNDGGAQQGFSQAGIMLQFPSSVTRLRCSAATAGQAPRRLL
jgi:hypothetical protein